MDKALSCGCIVEIELIGYGQIWSEVDIEYCPKHAAAPAMYKAIENLLVRLEQIAATDKTLAFDIDDEFSEQIIAVRTAFELAARVKK